MKKNAVLKIAVTGGFSAIGFLFMLLEFPLSFLLPSFVKMDFSELPALIAAFSMGTPYGILVCLFKNLCHLPFSATGGVGELCNFLLGVAFTVPAGLIYRHRHTRRGAILGSVIGALVMAVCSLPINYFISYPVYAKFLPIAEIIALYQSYLPSVDGLFSALLIFNLPFTLVKGLLDTGLTFLIYKRLSPTIHRLTGVGK